MLGMMIKIGNFFGKLNNLEEQPTVKECFLLIYCKLLIHENNQYSFISLKSNLNW